MGIVPGRGISTVQSYSPNFDEYGLRILSAHYCLLFLSIAGTRSPRFLARFASSVLFVPSTVENTARSLHQQTRQAAVDISSYDHEEESGTQRYCFSHSHSQKHCEGG